MGGGRSPDLDVVKVITHLHRLLIQMSQRNEHEVASANSSKSNRKGGGAAGKSAPEGWYDVPKIIDKDSLTYPPLVPPVGGEGGSDGGRRGAGRGYGQVK